ncbi:MAG TPA: cysteine desulfurase family protein [Myxococcota bacterium]|nr:cysteine desulfurase family protein [Myxococcota bacterium]HQK51036.1 cysteine desulfurase family protein [Myxococcota bacterium]
MAIYLDNLATTPLDPEVLQAMLPWLGRPCNAHARIHPHGVEAARAVERAREQVARACGVRSSEVFFTPSATAANNLAVAGIAEARGRRGRHLLATTIEHPSVREPLRALAGGGWEVEWLPIGSSGVLDPDEVRRRLRPDTVLVSVMAVNNEIGTIQPIEAIREVLGRKGPLLHVDAAQAAGKVPLAPLAAAADLMTLSSHKVYGPQGAAALVLREGRSVRPVPRILGGGQEGGLWPGTLAVAPVVGFGEALARAVEGLARDRDHVASLGRRLEEGLARLLPGLRRNGDPDRAVPHCRSLTIPVLAGETVIAWLARAGISVSLGSACSVEAARPSPVLEAIGVPAEAARRTLRFGLGRFNTIEDIDAVLAAFDDLLGRLRDAGMDLGPPSPGA